MAALLLISLLAAGCAPAAPTQDGGHAAADGGDGGPSGGDGGSDGGEVLTGRWTPAHPLPVPLQEVAVVFAAGEVYVLGGFDDRGQVVASVYAYAPDEDRWREAAELPQPVHHANAAVVDDRIYVLGFLRGTGFEARGEAYVYDPAAGGWRDLAPMPADEVRGASGVAVIGRRIYVVGGFRGGAVTDVSSFDTSTETWARAAALPQPLDHLVAGGIDGRVYVAGGRNARIDTHVATTLRYDPETDVWSEGAPMPTSRAGAAGTVHGGRLFVFGGEGAANETGVFDAVESYDPVRDQWAVHTPMGVPRHGTGAASDGKRIIVPGGADRQAFAAVRTVEIFEL